MSVNPPAGEALSRPVLNFLKNTLLQNRYWASREALSRHNYGTKRDIDRACDYPPVITLRMYTDMYDRDGIAKRVVDAFPNECFALSPEVSDVPAQKQSEFSDAVKSLNRRVALNHYLHRLDVRSGLGHFGVMLMGFDKTDALDTKLTGITEFGERDDRGRQHKLNFLRIFDESLVSILEFEEDTSNPRFGQPKYYSIRLANPVTAALVEGELGAVAPPTKEVVPVRVHWSRVIHAADQRQSSETYGQPRMKAVFNYLINLRKVIGGAAEMFWKGGFPGYSFEVDAAVAAEIDLDLEGIKKEMAAYSDELQRFLTAVGGSWKSLAPQVANPKNHIEVLLQAVAMSLGIPLRIFTGSEAAHLASTQDGATWHQRVKKRQTDYLEPMLLRPFYDRMQILGVLPQVDNYDIFWPSLDSPTPTAQADIAVKLTNALQMYVTGGIESVMDLKDYLVIVHGFGLAVADEVVKARQNRSSGLLLTKDFHEMTNQPAASGVNPDVARGRPKTTGGGVK